MKKEWSTPSCAVESFEANEYVAVCWAIGCVGGYGEKNVPEAVYGASNWNGSETSGEHDHTGDCQNPLKNRITEVNGVITIQENNSQQGWLPGFIDGYVDNNGNNKIDDGDLVYWHTTNTSDGRRWNHAGYAENVSASHPNHS